MRFYRIQRVFYIKCGRLVYRAEGASDLSRRNFNRMRKGRSFPFRIIHLRKVNVLKQAVWLCLVKRAAKFSFTIRF